MVMMMVVRNSGENAYVEEGEGGGREEKESYLTKELMVRVVRRGEDRIPFL